MQQEIKSDKDYIEAFNHGYELAKELGLKSDILNDLAAGNHRMQAMKEGMEQYGKELIQDKDKDVIPSLDLDSIEERHIDIKGPNKSKDKGLDMDI